MVKFKDNKVFVVGDTHSIGVFFRVLDDVPNGVDIIHIGDLGVGFGGRPAEKKLLNKLNDKIAAKECKCFVIRGNHDDPSYWPFKLSHLSLVADYTEAVFPDKTHALLVGGGISVDRCVRFVNCDYWKGELTPEPPADLDTFDVVFAHDCPSYINHSTEGLKKNWAWSVSQDSKLIEDSHRQRGVLDAVAELAEPKYWVYGHFHNDLVTETKRPYGWLKSYCINICKIKEFDTKGNVTYFNPPDRNFI